MYDGKGRAVRIKLVNLYGNCHYANISLEMASQTR